MCLGSCVSAAGEDEEAQRRQQRLQAVYLRFEPCHHLGRNDVAGTHLTLRGVRGQIAAEHEKRALHVEEHIHILLVAEFRHQHTDVGVEFINGAVALQPLAAFADALPAHEGGLAGVACLSVYLHCLKNILHFKNGMGRARTRSTRWSQSFIISR